MHRRLAGRRTTLLVMTAILGLAGCTSTNDVGGVVPSGFLGDYSGFREGLKDEAQLIYVDPQVDFRNYRRVILEPISFWFTPDGNLANVPREDRDALAQRLAGAIWVELQKDYSFTEDPGPDVMRLRLAITEAVGSRVAGGVVTSTTPAGPADSGDRELTAGTHSYVRKAAIEAELVDSVTGRRLAAAVDARGGRKTTSGSTPTWSDVETAYDHWAQRLRQRLTELRSKRR